MRKEEKEELGLDFENQKKLMEMVVGQVLKKHKVSTKDTKLSSSEKKQIKEIVGNIETEVQRFLENQNKSLTEHDFSDENQNQVVDNRPKAKKKVFKSPNDLNAVRTFLDQYRK